MTPESIIREAQKEGVKLALAPAGTNIQVTSDGATVNRWLPVIRERKAEIMKALNHADSNSATASRWWLIHYPNRDPLEVATCPPASLAEIMQVFPGSNARPCQRAPAVPAPAMTASEEAIVLHWLHAIGEQDAETIAEVLHGCQRDAKIRQYFVHQAGLAGVNGSN